MLRLLGRIERQMTAASLVCAVVCLLLLSMSCLYQVLSRFVLQNPISWSEPLTRLFMVWAVFLALPAAFRRGSMVSMNIVPAYFGENRLRIIVPITSAVILVLLISTWYGFTILPRVRFQTIAGLQISIVWAYLAIPLGTALSAFAALMRAVDIVSTDQTAQSGAPDG